MDRDTIRRMDPELYQEKLEKAVMDDVSCILNINKGHSSVLHAGQSIDDMAMRVVKEGKQAVSSFYNAESLIGNLQDAVYFEAENITNCNGSHAGSYTSACRLQTAVKTIGRYQDTQREHGPLALFKTSGDQNAALGRSSVESFLFCGYRK